MYKFPVLLRTGGCFKANGHMTSVFIAITAQYTTAQYFGIMVFSIRRYIVQSIFISLGLFYISQFVLYFLICSTIRNMCHNMLIFGMLIMDW
jgi:hypothetical protein